MPEESEIQQCWRELNACSFQRWYHNYEKISIESTCLKIPANVVRYLLDEIIILPKECTPENELNVTHEGYEDEDTENVEVCLLSIVT